MSITRKIVEETLDKVYEYLKNESVKYNPLKNTTIKQKIIRMINKPLERLFGIHLTRWEYIKNLE